MLQDAQKGTGRALRRVFHLAAAEATSRDQMAFPPPFSAVGRGDALHLVLFDFSLSRCTELSALRAMHPRNTVFSSRHVIVRGCRAQHNGRWFRRLDAKGVRLQVVLDPLAGPVSGDPSRLQQVFWNLLTNAVTRLTLLVNRRCIICRVQQPDSFGHCSHRL